MPDSYSVLFNPQETGDALYEIVEQRDLGAAHAGGQAQLDSIGGGMIFETENPRVLRHIRTKEILVKTIPQRWHEQLRGVILDANKTGEPVEEIRRRLQEKFTHYKGWEARRIAQTETIGAYNVGGFSGIEQAEIEEKEWVSTIDDLTRDSHIAIDGEKQPTKQPFSNGLMYPGDASGEPAEVINCRCAVIAAV